MTLAEIASRVVFGLAVFGGLILFTLVLDLAADFIIEFFVPSGRSKKRKDK